MTRRDLAAAAEALGRRAQRPARAWRCTCRSTPRRHLGEVSRLINDVVASGLPTRTVFVSHLTDGRARPARDDATPTSPSARASAPTCGSATAAPCAVTATVLDVHAVERGDTFGYRGRTVPKQRPHRRRQRRHRPRHRPRGADRRPVAEGARRDPGPRRPGRGRLRALAVLDRRQAAALRRAAAHAGLDAVRAVRRARARASARTSRSGSASPRPTSTGSSSPDSASRSTATASHTSPTTRSRTASQ